MFVFRDSEAKEEVNFPVPYFNEYWSVPIIELGEWRTVSSVWSVRNVIQGQRMKPNVTCPNCLLAYFYRPDVGEIQCLLPVVWQQLLKKPGSTKMRYVCQHSILVNLKRAQWTQLTSNHEIGIMES